MLAKLLSRFEGRIEAPVEVTEVADGLISLGVQDRIIFSPEDMDPGKVRGAYYQYTTHGVMYGDPDLVSLIVYSQNLDLPWQRLVCCKELIHICDAAIEKTHEPDQVSELLDRLLGPLSTEDYGLADLAASVDKLAIYKALAFLFPAEARKVALSMLASGERRVEDVARWVDLPESLVEFVLDEGWPDIRSQLFDC